MEATIHKSPGRRNDLLVRIPRSELARVHFNITNRAEFMRLPGYLRSADYQDSQQRAAVSKLKRPLEIHLRELTTRGAGLIDENGTPVRRIIAIGSRNIGNNRGFIAWQRDETPRVFVIQGDTLHGQSVPMLTSGPNAAFAVRDLLVTEDKLLENGRDVSGEIDWCVYANCVLRHSTPLPIEEIADQFYDIGHLFGIDRNSESGRAILRELYDGASVRSRETIIDVSRKHRLPRNRFLHNALGLSEREILIFQREGTVEEIAHWLLEAGAGDAFILDNGGSVFCWTWWIGENGGYLFRAPDFRPPCSAVLVFVLNGPVSANLPSGSVSYSVI